MSPFRALLLCALVCSCHRPPQARPEHRITDPKKLAELRRAFVPEAYLRPEDQKKAERLRDGYSGPMPCEYDKIEGGVHVIAGPPVDQCFKMTKPQRWQGLWRNNFEGSEFCAAPAGKCPSDYPSNFVWLDIETSLPGARDTPPGGLYAIEFIGRKTAYSGIYDGGAPEEVILDRLLSIKEIEPPPQQPTKIEMINYFKKCEKANTCKPNWNEINEIDDAQIRREHIEGYLKECAGKPICMPNSEIPRNK